jgi:hydrogenase maturation protease
VSPEKKVAVIGVGNILMGDEGLGVRALELLEKRRAEFGGRVSLVDAGTALLDVIDDCTTFDVLLVIDAVRAGGEPGAVYRFDIAALGREKAHGLPTSLHETSVLEALEMERLTGRSVPETVVVGMEPERISAGMDLSATVAGKLPLLVRTVLDELKRVFHDESLS